jgi:predicted glycoside hydrolase/deacetylase ChbG (UPF0249 family)
MERYLIVNADDFGLSERVNAGIVQARRLGILTAASLMVRGAAARHAVETAEGIDLGLHIDLGEWVYRDGQWSVRYERTSSENPHAIATEVYAQLVEFRQLTGQDPSHIDSHQHVHSQEPVRGIIAGLARELGVPLRGEGQTIHYCGEFYGQSGKGVPCPEAISASSLVSLLKRLANGVTELGCHPGRDRELDSTYRLERLIETETLCDPRVHKAIDELGIKLISFKDLRRGATEACVPFVGRSESITASSP